MDGSTPVASVAPFFTTMPRVHLEKDVTFAVEQDLPIHLTSERILTGKYDAVYSPSGAELKILSSETPLQKVVIQGRELYVIFIPTQVSSKEAT